MKIKIEIDVQGPTQDEILENLKVALSQAQHLKGVDFSSGCPNKWSINVKSEGLEELYKELSMNPLEEPIPNLNMIDIPEFAKDFQDYENFDTSDLEDVIRSHPNVMFEIEKWSLELKGKIEDVLPAANKIDSIQFDASLDAKFNGERDGLYFASYSFY